MRGKSIFLWTALFLTATLVQAKDDNSPVINIKGNIEQNTISVNGESHKWITPDRIYLNIIIDENDTKGKISLESLESKMIDQLTQLGIDIKKQKV